MHPRKRFEVCSEIDCQLAQEVAKLNWTERMRLSITAPDAPAPEVPQEQPMSSVTGASYLGDMARRRVAAAKERIGRTQASLDTSLARVDDATSRMEGVAKVIEREADDLDAAVGQFSNGGPE